ncbi:unnamed protein product [Bursaphelenchus okinawaensis]|uniref:Mediator of RNA polymerase II transcription subunit 6 n=1 Tax=Bursaphelenchus okinawaensis TaxID=465554 RepID=A0A811LGE1_9BILA|nr:unnamed protein product [Bursaphelenchus okinawaensis]CAG9121945.1 unnamed protein product [Bursaphelenchus okinawaensis]
MMSGRIPQPQDPEELNRQSYSNFLQIPQNAINRDNVLTYFCDPKNPFYDNQSDNEQLRMQRQSTMPNGIAFIEDMLPQLNRMVNGIQYVVHDGQPPLFVIRKQRRTSVSQYQPLAFYYVLNGVVYQAPSIYTIAQSRLVGAVEPLKKGFTEALSYLRFNVNKGYYWEFKDGQKKSGSKEEPQEVPNSQKKEDEPWNTRATPYQHNRTEMLLAYLKEEFSTEKTEKPKTNGTRPNSAAATPQIGAATPQITDNATFLAPTAPISQPISGAQANVGLDLPGVLPMSNSNASHFIGAAVKQKNEAMDTS